MLGNNALVTHKFNGGILKKYADELKLKSITEATMTRDIIQWLQAPLLVRQILFLNIQELRALLAEKENRQSSSYSKLSKEQLINRITGNRYSTNPKSRPHNFNHFQPWQG